MTTDLSKPVLSRRGWLQAASCALGGLTVSGLAPDVATAGLLSPREPHFNP